jgi:uncharacterized damage-inducible protein DinB
MSDIDLLLFNLDQAFAKRAWHGTNLRGSLRGLSAEQASRRPGKERHNVWELALHCAYWKYAVRRRLTGEPKGGFPLAGSNFFPRPVGKPDDAAWRADLKLLDRCHADLRAVVAALSAAELDRKPQGSRFTVRETVIGIASHDLYHAGQIQLVKRLTSR